MDKPKIKPLRIDGGSCVVYIGRKVKGTEITEQGEPVYPHKGEWVEIIPVGSVQQVITLGEIMREGKDTKSVELLEKIEPAFNELCELIAEKVMAWNFTDWMGKELPQPHGKPKVIASLTEDEVLWLLTCVQLESSGERKKD
ncbi:hypothetical protein CMI37_13915 [Candidatus Pacearchaeota archaeon]|nr:hypothetical protein [Candidatus Pacearchaeota archaeon]|tara:strand:- start:711 stop:1136 length:426 start_codon:yes stop_codon:yes gene_type:complete